MNRDEVFEILFPRHAVQPMLGGGDDATITETTKNFAVQENKSDLQTNLPVESQELCAICLDSIGKQNA